MPAPLFNYRLPPQDNLLDVVDVVTKKVDRPVTTKWSALRWYWQMVYGHVQAVNRHVPDYRGKIILIPSVIFCMVVKWGWFLKAFLDLSRRKQGDD